MFAALAGTQFSITPGPPWQESDESGLLGEANSSGAHDEAKKTELVCIGQELDRNAVAEALDRCLLTEKEMARGVAHWSSLPDPFIYAEGHHEHDH